MGRGFLAATLAVVLVGAGLLGSLRAIAHGSVVCGAASKGDTLLEGRKARIYSLPGAEPPNTERIFGCLVSKGGISISQLNRQPKHAPFCCGRWPGVDTEHLAIHAPWVAYQENFSGVDTSVATIAAKNLLTGFVSYCHIGGRFLSKPGPAATGIVVKGNGSRAWVGEATFNRVHEVGACASTEREFEETEVESGLDIDLESLALHGSTLTWTNGGETRSATLP